jgi:hypothetical protein
MCIKREGDETARGRNDLGRNGKGTKRSGTKRQGDETTSYRDIYKQIVNLL